MHRLLLPVFSILLPQCPDILIGKFQTAFPLRLQAGLKILDLGDGCS